MKDSHIVSLVFTKAERDVLRKIGKRNGKLGGKARAESLTPQRRSDIARLAAQARWAKDRKTA